MIYSEITISKDKYRELYIVFWRIQGIKKLPSIDGTEESGIIDIFGW